MGNFKTVGRCPTPRHFLKKVDKNFNFLIFFCISILCLTGCVSRVEKRAHYLPFPTYEDGFITAMNEVGLDWDIFRLPDGLYTPSPGSDASFIHISDKIDFAFCSINMFSNTYGMGDVFGTRNHIYLYFLFKPQSLSPECISAALYNYDRFMQDEWPLFWTLSGLIFDSIDDINLLYAEYGRAPDMLVWSGIINGVHGYVSFNWNNWLERYTLSEMRFNK